MSKNLIKVFLSVGIILAILSFIDTTEVVAAFSELTPRSIYYLMMVSFLLVYLSAIKWSLFVNYFGAKIPVFHLFSLYLIGYFVNLIAPSYIGGDATRSWYVGRKIGQHEALTATLLERYTGMVAMLGLATIFIWVVDLVTWPIRLVVLSAALGLLVTTVIALSDQTLVLLSKIKPIAPIIKHLRKIQEGFRIARKDKALLAKAILASFVYHSFTVINVLTAAVAIGWDNPPIVDLFVVLPLILLIGAIPIAPNGLGLQEGAYVYFLTGIGATPSQALAIGIVLRAKSYILAALGGVVWLGRGARKQKGISAA